MVNICSRRCLHDSCTKQPNFNFEGNKPTHCKQHAKDGMVYVSARGSRRSPNDSSKVSGATRGAPTDAVPTDGMPTVHVRLKKEI